MKGTVFARLVANLKRDGILTQLPVVNLQDGELEIASGNHRTEAAIAAGIEEGDALEILTPLTREQFIALQLSHNAVVGEDDPNVLKELYSELGFDWKEYSGLTDDAFDIKDLDTTVMRVEQPFYEELTISFLPGDMQVFRSWLDKIAASKTAKTRLVGMYEDFRLFFETVLEVKRVTDVHNSAVALRLMAEYAAKALKQEEADAAAKAKAEAAPAPKRKKNQNAGTEA